MRYDDVAAAVADTGMMLRGGFEVSGDDGVPNLADGRPARCALIVGNVAGAMWERFRAERPDGPNPLDAWTRAVLRPIAASFGADFVHPSDEPFRPFQRWARRADDVWPSPIGLLIHRTYGLWHAYRGAFLVAEDVTGLPARELGASPCVDCVGQPCLTTCPVDAFAPGAYDADRCAAHVASGETPACLSEGCAARLACPVAPDGRYGPDQMRFHMRAFVGLRSDG